MVDNKNFMKNIVLVHLPTKQRGVVLIVSLVFLIALTAVAAALMQNTTTDMKMSGASEEKVVATQEAISAVDEVIYNQLTPGATNTFQKPFITFPVNDGLLPGTKTSSTASLEIINNEYGLEVHCPRAVLASSTGTISCNIVNVQVNRNYGRTKKSVITVNSGIAQPLL